MVDTVVAVMLVSISASVSWCSSPWSIAATSEAEQVVSWL